MHWETSLQQLQNHQYLISLENKKRVYGEFIYILTVTGFHKTGPEATKLHTSSCNKNRDNLW